MYINSAWIIRTFLADKLVFCSMYLFIYDFKCETMFTQVSGNGFFTIQNFSSTNNLGFKLSRSTEVSRQRALNWQMCLLQVLCLNFVCEFFITVVLFYTCAFLQCMCCKRPSSKNCSMILEQHCKIFRYAILLLDIKADSRKGRVFSTYVALAPWQIGLKKNFHCCHNVN